MRLLSHRTKRKIFIFALIGLIGVSGLLYFRSDFFSVSQKKAEGEKSQKSEENGARGYASYMSELLKSMLDTTPNTKKELVLNYCSTVLEEGSFENIRKSGIVFQYKPSKSVFLHNLCNTFGKDFSEKFDIKKDFLKKKKYEEFENRETDSGGSRNPDGSEGERGPCHPDTNINDCELGYRLTDKFNQLINEYFNIKLATVYGYQGDIEESIKKFSNKYFPTKDCKGDRYYLFKENITEEGQKYCSHPETYGMLKSQMKNIQSLADNTEYLDTSAIFDSEKNELFLSNAFSNYSTPVGSDIKDFKNLYLNDYMFYRLFLVYYSYAISTNGKFSEFQVRSNVSNKIKSDSSETVFIENQLVRTKRAIQRSNRVLANVYYTYPIHIGLMAYYEDLKVFRDNFVKLYTPFHQLYYKLRNVQTMRR